MVLLVSELAQGGQQYPEAKVRAAAADVARVVASRHLVHQENARIYPDLRLLRAIEKLAPEDHLLARAIARGFSASRKSAWHRRRQTRLAPAGAPKSVPEARSSGKSAARLLEWPTAAGTNEYLYVAGHYLERRLIVRVASEARWTNIYQLPQTVWWPRAGRSTASNRYSWRPVPRIATKRGFKDKRPLHFALLSMPAADLDEKTVILRTPPWSNSETIAFARAEQGVSWAVSAANGLVVRARLRGPDGTPIFSREVDTTDVCLTGSEIDCSACPGRRPLFCNRQSVHERIDGRQSIKSLGGQRADSRSERFARALLRGCGSP